MIGQDNGSRIAKNTAILYFRLLLTMCISLYTSRVILQSLGVSDFGIYNVVGGVVAMFSFFTSSISSSFQRFFCIELGTKNILKLKQLVGTSILILALFSVVVLLIAETVGLWFVKNQLVIPSEKIFQAVVVFQFSILSFIVCLFQSMYNAIIISYEKMNVFAYISIFDVISKLLIALSVNLFTDNRLIYYSGFIFISSVLSLIIYYSYCRYSYEVSKGVFDFKIKLFIDVFRFSGWTLFGTFANVLKSNGLNILLNLFFGPIVNAARGISYQVYTAATSFTRSFQVAFTPQITKSYADGNYVYVQKLMLSSSKMSFYLMLFLSIPIFVDTNFILYCWLGDNVPEHTVSFTRIVILTGLVESLSAPVVNIIYANGRIMKFQIVISLVILLIIPLAYLLLTFGYSPDSTLLVSLFFTIIAHFIRLIFLKKQFSFSLLNYLKEVIIPVSIFTVFLTLLPSILSKVYVSSIINYLLVVCVVELLVIIAIYNWGLRKDERYSVRLKLCKFIKNAKK